MRMRFREMISTDLSAVGTVPAERSAHNESRAPRIPTHAEAQPNPGILQAFNAAVVEEFRSNRGRVGGPFADSDVVLLTTACAKSGQRRQSPLDSHRRHQRRSSAESCVGSQSSGTPRCAR